MQNNSTLCSYGYKARIDYNDGTIETITLSDDVGQNPYEVGAIINKAFAHEERTKIKPTVEYFLYNKTVERLEKISVYGGKAIAGLMVGSSFLAGFLDRYRMTLAARIDGIRRAIGVINDLTQPCKDRLIAALNDLEKAKSLAIELEHTTRHELAQQVLFDTETKTKGLEVCANVAHEFTKIVEPMEKLNAAMAGEGLATKLRLAVANLDMSVLTEAWKDYSLGEQSLPFLLNVAASVGVGLSVFSAAKEVCTLIPSLTEERKNLLALTAGVVSGIYIATYGNGLVQAITIGASAYGVQLAAKSVRTLKSFIGW